MNNAAPLTPRHRVEAFTASALFWLAWLAAVIAALGAPRRSRLLKRFVKRLERAAECIIFLHATRCVRRPPRRGRRPAAAAPGFRHSRSSFRLFMKSARVRARGAGLRERIDRILAALANPTPYIARFVKRLRRGLCGAHFVAAAPPACACAGLVHVNACAIDDS
jgi:hypothetical protein